MTPLRPALYPANRPRMVEQDVTALRALCVAVVTWVVTGCAVSFNDYPVGDLHPVGGVPSNGGGSDVAGGASGGAADGGGSGGEVTSGGAGYGGTGGTTGGAPNGGSATGGSRTGGTTMGGSATGGAATGGTAGSSPGCPGTGGPAMVKLPEGYCIDSTEVTRAHYAAWLAGKPSTAGQLPECASNTSFEPAATCLAMSYVCRTGCDNHPQVCIDWCDAYAYCQAVGKRLCGKIGGGPNGYADADATDASLSQWFNACSSHGAYSWPYGNTYHETACNGCDYWEVVDSVNNRITASVGSFSSCRSPEAAYSGIDDLSGNVWEWEDSCATTNVAASCRIRGGSFYETSYTNGSGMSCGNRNGIVRMSEAEYIGFRCCS